MGFEHSQNKKNKKIKAISPNKELILEISKRKGNLKSKRGNGFAYNVRSIKRE